MPATGQAKSHWSLPEPVSWSREGEAIGRAQDAAAAAADQNGVTHAGPLEQRPDSHSNWELTPFCHEAPPSVVRRIVPYAAGDPAGAGVLAVQPIHPGVVEGSCWADQVMPPLLVLIKVAAPVAPQLVRPAHRIARLAIGEVEIAPVDARLGVDLLPAVHRREDDGGRGGRGSSRRRGRRGCGAWAYSSASPSALALASPSQSGCVSVGVAVGVSVGVRVGVGVGGGLSANETVWTVSVMTVTGAGLEGVNTSRPDGTSISTV